MKLDKGQRNRLRDMAQNLMSPYLTFRWSETPEGQDYWEEVHTKLCKMSREPEKCETCGQELP